MREEASQALGELKSSVYQNFVMIKSEKIVEACKESLKVAENCNSDDIRKLFESQVNPRNKKIGIQHVKEISENRIVVNYAFEKDRNKLKTMIESNPKFLKPTVPKCKNLTMLIRNVPNDIADSELLDVIREQNPEILVSNECWNELRVHFVLKKFQHVRTVVIEFHPKIRKNVTVVGSLKIM
ncbi:hypothetical protein TNIN_461531 [Trichonephila inaurata madagascariensis]|uniref:Uncharacterized protein n=1 Tax=Trichonephila inaurata madagascariensis TaxID=2747483 RepID=A0A8X6YA36_9ARAC|nr:hypothetical protein TNIN_461531 [Trichonephila inaurata madagascariensis]